MSRFCPEKGGPALYLECLECEEKTCQKERKIMQEEKNINEATEQISSPKHIQDCDIEFSVAVKCGDVFVNGKFVSQLCWSNEAIGMAITAWLNGKADVEDVEGQNEMVL